MFGFLYLYRGSLAAAAAAAAAIVYGILALLLVMTLRPKLTVEIAGGGMVEKGEELEETVTLRNGSALPVTACDLSIRNRNCVTGQEKLLPLKFSLRGRGGQSQSLRVSDRLCGGQELTVGSLYVCDPLRLFRRKQETAARCMGFVAPELKPVMIPDSYLDSYNMESYMYSQYEKGNDTGEVFGIRDYQEGDSPKQIHWKLSAKLDDLIVKIPSFPIENNIIVLLDNCILPETEMSPERKSGLVELFFALSSELLEKNMSHSIGWYDTVNQHFSIRTVTNREEMWICIPEVLSSGFEVSPVSTVYRYLETLRGSGFSNHFLATGQADWDLDKLEAYGAVKVFRYN